MQKLYERPALVEIGRVVDVTFGPYGPCVDGFGGYRP
jgi:hypothetical protein